MCGWFVCCSRSDDQVADDVERASDEMEAEDVDSVALSHHAKRVEVVAVHGEDLGSHAACEGVDEEFVLPVVLQQQGFVGDLSTLDVTWTPGSFASEHTELGEGVTARAKDHTPDGAGDLCFGFSSGAVSLEQDVFVHLQGVELLFHEDLTRFGPDEQDAFAADGLVVVLRALGLDTVTPPEVFDAGFFGAGDEPDADVWSRADCIHVDLVRLVRHLYFATVPVQGLKPVSPDPGHLPIDAPEPRVEQVVLGANRLQAGLGVGVVPEEGVVLFQSERDAEEILLDACRDFSDVRASALLVMVLTPADVMQITVLVVFTVVHQRVFTPVGEEDTHGQFFGVVPEVVQVLLAQAFFLRPGDQAAGHLVACHQDGDLAVRGDGVCQCAFVEVFQTGAQDDVVREFREVAFEKFEGCFHQGTGFLCQAGKGALSDLSPDVVEALLGHCLSSVQSRPSRTVRGTNLSGRFA